MVRQHVRGLVRRVRRRLRRQMDGRRLAAARSRGAAGRTRLRVDPVPPLEPLPAARYAFLIGAIPRRFGGRTASILMKARLLQEIGGVGSTVVTLNHARALPQVTAGLRRRGLLVDGVEVVNLYDHLRGPGAPVGEVRHEVDEPGLTTVEDEDGRVRRLLADGVCRVRKRYDGAGRLQVRDEFDQDGAWTRSDDFGQDGTLRRTTLMEHDLPREQVFYRADGSTYLRKDLRADASGTAVVTAVTVCDDQSRPTAVLADDVALVHHFLDRLFGDDHVFLTTESRQSDAEVLGYVRPNVKRLALLHNLHLAFPGENPDDVRRSYQPLFDHRDELDAVVFLTNGQRADAEAHYGRHDNFRVVPHPAAAPPRPVPFERRDPDLVVMLARLHPQKQLGHAIRAFARVVSAVPTARLEIYGEGPERAALQRLIDQRGLGASVTLPGYTRDPAAVYRRAALSLLTSRNEGYPLALLETLNHGCPVVTYDVKYGPSEIVTDGATGFLVPGGDVRGLARRVVEVLTDEPLRRRLSEGAATPDPRFSRETFVARWSHIFRDLDGQGWG